ncbi:MAG: hypothetical protein PHT33_05205, partial [bacterium]|nr:hypothetical protein [bacterium]
RLITKLFKGNTELDAVQNMISVAPRLDRDNIYPNNVICLDTSDPDKCLDDLNKMKALGLNTVQTSITAFICRLMHPMPTL